jgi:hypothetical protein
MVWWLKSSGDYIMNFYRQKGVFHKKTESRGHTRWPQATGARPGGRVRPTPLGTPLWLVATSCTLRTPFSCGILLLVGKNLLYNLPKVSTSIPRQNPLFLCLANSAADLKQHVFARVSRGESCLSPDTGPKSIQRSWPLWVVNRGRDGS